MGHTVINVLGHTDSDFPSRDTVQAKEQIVEQAAYLRSLAGGVRPATSVEQIDSAVKATGTLTIASVLATHTFTVNGVTFTGVAGAAGNNQFSVDGSGDAADATAIAAAINASTTDLVKEHVSAEANGAVVTLTAKQPGHAGNAVSIAGGQASVAASGARLTGGSGTRKTFTP